MLRKIVWFVILIVVFGVSHLTVVAGAGSIPVAEINGLHGRWEVSCPDGNIAGARAYLDTPDNAVYELSTGSASFDIPPERVSNGHHNLVFQVRCGDESWEQATTSTKDFNWSAPAAPQVPQCTLSTNPSGSVTGLVGRPVTINYTAACDTGVSAVRATVNGGMTQDNLPAQGNFTWVPQDVNPASVPLCILAVGNGDDNWQHTQMACVTVQVTVYGQPVATDVPPVVNPNDPTPIPQGNGDQNGTVPTALPTDPSGNPVIVPTEVPVVPTQPAMLVECLSQSNQRVGIVGEPFIHSSEGKDTPRIGWTRAGNEFDYVSTGPQGWYQISCGNFIGWVSNDGSLTYYRHLEPALPTDVPPTAPPPVPTVFVPAYAQFQSGDGIDIGGYCPARYSGAQATHIGNDPFTWDCGNMGISRDSMCSDVWGPERPFAHANVNELGSLTCQSSPQGEPQPPHPEARTADGGVDVYKICIAWGWKDANHSDSGADVAYTVRCVTDQKVMYLGKPEFDQACRDAWGRTFYAELLNPDSLGGWKCVQNPNAIAATPNGIDPRATTPIPPTSVPQPPIVVTPGPVIVIGNCTASVQSRLSINGQGRALGDRYVRSGPSLGYGIVATMPSGQIFTVLNASACKDGYIWSQISYGNVTGWTAEASAQGSYFVELYSATSQPPVQPPAGGSSGDIVFVSLPDGSQLTLSYDRVNYRILNGAQVVAWEIDRLMNRLQRPFECIVSTTDCIQFQSTKPFMDAVAYNAELIGEVEVIRKAVEATLCGGITTCQKALRYVVGSKLMDTSGPGNVVFGFMCADMKVPQASVEDRFSNFAQIISSLVNENLKWQTTDYPDDLEQRRLGRKIYEITGFSTVYATSVEAAVPNVGELNRS